jgi:hypothetical protein
MWLRIIHGAVKFKNSPAPQLIYANLVAIFNLSLTKKVNAD